MIERERAAAGAPLLALADAEDSSLLPWFERRITEEGRGSDASSVAAFRGRREYMEDRAVRIDDFFAFFNAGPARPGPVPGRDGVPKKTAELSPQVGAAIASWLDLTEKPASAALAGLAKKWPTAVTKAKRVSLYAIFDGHSGALASHFCAQYLPWVLGAVLGNAGEALEAANRDTFAARRPSASEEEIKHTSSLTPFVPLAVPQNASGADFAPILRDVFVLLDRLLITAGFDDGSTGVVSLVLDDVAVVASAGDSEGLVVFRREGRDGEVEVDAAEGGGGEAGTGEKGLEAARAEAARKENGYAYRVLTKKWKPTDPPEKERIEAAGGVIIFGRLGGELAVSRGFGDRTMKTPFCGTPADLVSVRPFCKVMTLAKSCVALVLACDGLWDKVTYQEAAEAAGLAIDEERRNDADKDRQAAVGKDPLSCARHLAQLAIDRESGDNTTVLVVNVVGRGKAAGLPKVDVALDG